MRIPHTVNPLFEAAAAFESSKVRSRCSMMACLGHGLYMKAASTNKSTVCQIGVFKELMYLQMSGYV